MADDRSGPVVVRVIPAEAAGPLRLDVLRPGQSPENCVYPGDDHPTTRHFGAYLDGALVGIGSLYREARPGGPESGWRLRGMATTPEVRGRGVGRSVLQAAVDHAAAEGGAEVWCNARMVAVDFYRRAGFDVVSDEFDIAGIGPHVVMRRALFPAGQR